MSNFALQLARRFEPRHLIIALVAVIVSFAALDLVYNHALDSLVAFHLDDSDPAVRNSFPAVVIGLMLIFAGALAFAVASMRDTARPAWWRATGIVLVFFGIEEALGLHTWADRHLEVDWNVTYLPFITIAAVVWFEAVRLMKGNRAAQLAVRGRHRRLADCGRVRRGPHRSRRGARRWRAPGDGSGAVCCCWGCSPSRAPARWPRTPPRRPRASPPLRSRAPRSAGWTSGSLVIGLALLGVVFGILGAIVYPGGGDLRAFDLNKEQTFPATFSGVLLLAAGGLALLNGLVRSDTAAGRRWWIVLALVFAFLGLDEIAALHEAVQDRVHVWGQAVLAPVVFVGVYAWWATLQRLRSEPPAGMLFMLGAGAWIVSQLIDAGLNEELGWTIVPEELFEMAGSALFGLALLVALRQLLAAEPATEREPARAAVSAGGLPVAAR